MTEFSFIISILNQDFSKIRSIGRNGNREGYHLAVEKGGAGGNGGWHIPLCVTVAALAAASLAWAAAASSGLLCISVGDHEQPVPFQQVENISAELPYKLIHTTQTETGAQQWYVSIGVS